MTIIEFIFQTIPNVQLAFFDPVSLGLMAGSALLSGIKGGKQAKDAADAQKRNAMQSALDTEYSPFVQQRGYKEKETDPGAGALGGAFQGALAGFNQGQLVKKFKGDEDIYSKMLREKLAAGGM